MADLIVALDVPSYEEAIPWVYKLKHKVKYFKVGSQIFVSSGPKIVKEIHDNGCEVFLDLKFHDIPNTVANAVVEAAKMGVYMLNVHASGGAHMMKTVVEKVDALSEDIRRPKLFAVTVLTSWSEELFQGIGNQRSIKEQVGFLAKTTKDSGFDGVVASAQETPLIRELCGEDFLIITPGIRLATDSLDDQKRAMTPKMAVEAGSDFLVMGRSILNAENPEEKVDQILEDIGTD